jgi:hypothetical protein
VQTWVRAWVQGCWPQRLSSRIVALFVGLLLAVQLTGFGLVHWSINRNARTQIVHDLEVGERVWARLLAQRAARLTLGATVLAADYGFRAAAASGDTETLSSALDNHGQRIGATLTAMLAPDLKPRALGESADRLALQALGPLAAKLTNHASTLAVLGGQPYQLVMVPMRAPQLVGYIVMGFPLDPTVVEAMKGLSGLDTVLLARTADGAERVALGTLPNDLAARLASARSDAGGRAAAAAGRAGAAQHRGNSARGQRTGRPAHGAAALGGRGGGALPRTADPAGRADPVGSAGRRRGQRLHRPPRDDAAAFAGAGH